MMRTLGMLLAVLGLAVFATGPTLTAADKGNTHSGTVVSASKDELVMTDKNGKEHTHHVAADVRITCDGKQCKLDDLKKGDKIRVTTEGTKVTRIEAKRAGSDKTNK